MHVFVDVTVANAAVPKANLEWVFLLGLAPFFVWFGCVVLLPWRRNACLAGGCAGRLVLWWLFLL